MPHHFLPHPFKFTVLILLYLSTLNNFCSSHIIIKPHDLSTQTKCFFIRNGAPCSQLPWEHFSRVVVVRLTLLLIFLNIRGEPVHPLLAALLGSFCLLKHFLHQATSLGGGRIALNMVWACFLIGWGRHCFIILLFRWLESFAKTNETSYGTDKCHEADITVLVICESFYFICWQLTNKCCLKHNFYYATTPQVRLHREAKFPGIFAFTHYQFNAICEVLRTPTTVLVAVARCISVCGTFEFDTGWLDVCFLRTGRNKFIVCDMLPKSVSLWRDHGIFSFKWFLSCLLRWLRKRHIGNWETDNWSEPRNHRHK